MQGVQSVVEKCHRATPWPSQSLLRIFAVIPKSYLTYGRDRNLSNDAFHDDTGLIYLIDQEQELKILRENKFSLYP